MADNKGEAPSRGRMTRRQAIGTMGAAVAGLAIGGTVALSPPTAEAADTTGTPPEELTPPGYPQEGTGPVEDGRIDTTDPNALTIRQYMENTLGAERFNDQILVQEVLVDPENVNGRPISDVLTYVVARMSGPEPPGGYDYNDLEMLGRGYAALEGKTVVVLPQLPVWWDWMINSEIDLSAVSRGIRSREDMAKAFGIEHVPMTGLALTWPSKKLADGSDNPDAYWPFEFRRMHFGVAGEGQYTQYLAVWVLDMPLSEYQSTTAQWARDMVAARSN